MQPVLDLLKSLHETVKDWDRGYPRNDSVLTRLVDDLTYLGSVHEQKQGTEDDVETVEEYLRMVPKIAQGLFDISFGLTNEQLQMIEAVSKGYNKGFEEGVKQFLTESYEKRNSESPCSEVFKRNASLAILHVEESLQYRGLLEPLKQYCSFLDSLPQR